MDVSEVLGRCVGVADAIFCLRSGVKGCLRERSGGDFYC